MSLVEGYHAQLIAAAPPRLAAWMQARPLVETIRRASNRMIIPLRRGTLTVNDSFYLSKDDKRFVVVGVFPAVRTDGKKVPAVLALALSGGDKGSMVKQDFSEGMYGGIATKLRMDGPVWYGAQAARRYKDYTTWMEKLGNADLILPFASAPEKPSEDDAPPPPSDVEDPALADVVIRHRPETGTVAAWDYPADRPRGDDTSIYRVMRKGGFVFAHHDKVWRRTNSVGLVETRAPIAWMVHELHRRGFKVFLDLGVGDAAEAVRVKAEYLKGRAERMAESAERQAAAAGYRLQGAAKQAEKELTHREIEGYYPTPPEVVDRVLATLGGVQGLTVLEPSAGHGALADALVEAGAGNVDVIEINPSLRKYLTEHGHAVVAADVFDAAFRPGSFYGAVAMNPPFEDGKAIDHVKRAFDFLEPGGELVSVVPTSIGFRSDKKHTAFRAWIDVHGGSLSAPSPATFGRATVNVQILHVTKPREAPVERIDDATMQTIIRARALAREVGGQRAAPVASEQQRWRERLHELKRSQEAGYRGHGEGLTKAEQAEKKGLEAALYAIELREKAARIERGASRVGEVDVSKGGRSALKPARRGRLPRAPRPPDPFWDAVLAGIRSLKRRTGASEIAKAFGDSGRKSWVVTFPDRRAYKVWVSVRDDYAYSGNGRKIGENEAEYDVYDIGPRPPGVYSGTREPIATGRIARDGAAIVEAIVNALVATKPA